MSRFKIAQKHLNNYPYKIAQLISILEYTRSCTIAVVEDFTKKQLDFVMDEKSNTAGNLLKHIAALEFQFQQVSFANRKLNVSEIKKWNGCFESDLLMHVSKNKSVSYYLALLNTQRKKTLELFKSKTNKWLLADNKLYPQANNLCFWYHLIEEEHCHMGQIKLLIKRI
jgi:Protein of unknown function (DUF664)